MSAVERNVECVPMSRAVNVGYAYTCNRCEARRKEQTENGVPEHQTTMFLYIGETSRTAFTRNLQHLEKYRAGGRGARSANEQDGGTFMWSHARDYHDGILGPNEGATDYTMKLDGTFQDTLTRQVDEDVRMRMNGWGEDEVQSRRRENISTTPDCVLMNGNGAFYQPKSVHTVFRQY